MLTNIPRSYKFRFENNFIDFLNLIKTASVTFKGQDLEIDGQLEGHSDISFNLYRGIDKFKRVLSDAWHDSNNSLEETLDNTYLKTDKFFLLSRYITEVESIQQLLTIEKGDFSHKNFYFSNISTEQKYQVVTLDQKEFQEYYFWMDHYVKKMLSYLNHIKSAIENVPQEEFRIPEYMKPDPNDSSFENPIGCFEYLFLNNGISRMRNQFVPTEEDYYHNDIIYDKEKEVLTIHDQDPETGEWETKVVHFKDKYRNRLYSSFLLSRKLIDEHINKDKKDDEIRTFISLILGKLKYLLKSIESNKDAIKYEESPKPIRGLIRYLYEKYDFFCPKADDLVEDILSEKIKKIEQSPPSKLIPQLSNTINVFMFKRRNIETFSTILYHGLTTGQLISKETDIQKIRKAFDGTAQVHPLKIRWIDRGKNGKCNKQTLLYLFRRLIEEGIIEEITDNKLLFQRLNFVFVDENGEQLQYLKESKAAAGKSSKTITYSKKVIDTAIKDINTATYGK
ncbi:hypothetical protein HGH92_11060 [Chitinophaga varians]|uniref:Uncharacterized protein n=1 Tax=Chitinophaga varians TaxID=2202339 RepID=A0A847RP13_9BACT|nr:hypothetical protein [Chitinophaga varians]NLR64843.1 hypothetical protein [Chitinophaga varians]